MSPSCVSVPEVRWPRMPVIRPETPAAARCLTFLPSAEPGPLSVWPRDGDGARATKGVTLGTIRAQKEAGPFLDMAPGHRVPT